MVTLAATIITGATEVLLPVAIDHARQVWEKDQVQYRAWMTDAFDEIRRRLERIEDKLYE